MATARDRRSAHARAAGREELASAVGTSIAAALACLHADGLVHCDVAPNNIARVSGVWKLIDLDRCVEEGEGG